MYATVDEYCTCSKHCGGLAAHTFGVFFLSFFFFFFLLKYGWPVSTVIFHFYHINVRSMLGDHGQLVIKKILKSGAELAS